MDSVTLYMRDIKSSTKLTSEEERILASRIQNGDKQALKILVQANLKFVVRVSQHYKNQGMPLADLINEGNLGLIKAALRFEGNRNIRFISYAIWWIRQGILEALAHQSRPISIPPSYNMGIHKINGAIQKLFRRLGRRPSVEELESETGLKANLIQDCLRLAEPCLSLNYSPENEAGSEFQDSLADHSQPNLEEILDQKKQRRTLANFLLRLNRREREVLRLYFGVETGVANTLGEIGNRFGLSRERVRQIKKKGMEKLGRLMITQKETLSFA